MMTMKKIKTPKKMTSSDKQLGKAQKAYSVGQKKLNRTMFNHAKATNPEGIVSSKTKVKTLKSPKISNSGE